MPVVDPVPYRPWRDRGHVVDGEFRWRLGARPLDLHDWIELGPDAEGADGWIAQKAAVMVEHAPTAFVVLDDVEPECAEIATALVEHLRQRWPDRYADVRLDPTLHPLDAAARLVPEDLIVMTERDGRRVFAGGSVCFPNRWNLPTKVGTDLTAVHAPVARLNEQLEDAVEGFLDRLRPDRSFWRLGWGIIDTPEGFTPLDGSGPPALERPTLDDLYVRVERETLRRFPATHAILFTIRTYLTPLRSVLADPDDRAAIGSIVHAMPAEVHRYKALSEAVRAALV